MIQELSAFKVLHGQRPDLGAIHTNEDWNLSKDIALDEIALVKKELPALQERLYSENKRSLLVIFQAMDAAGKDSAIKHVMSGLNPQGCQVYSFKQPTTEELDHDFLWRHSKALPERGRIGIHNRSHYENVLVCKVHPKIAANESSVPLEHINAAFWEKRYKSIRNFEEHLTGSGTTVLKFFLHISKKEQKKRFLDRISDPAKNWKFAASDLAERQMWDQYMEAYEECFTQTSTPECPWYIIPADKKWFARLMICRILAETLNTMNPQYPVLHEDDILQLEKSRELLLGEE
jgi:PPK2 family polyphosphate:nucleotide phosphotransferase